MKKTIDPNQDESGDEFDEKKSAQNSLEFD